MKNFWDNLPTRFKRPEFLIAFAVFLLYLPLIPTLAKQNGLVGTLVTIVIICAIIYFPLHWLFRRTRYVGNKVKRNLTGGKRAADAKAAGLLHCPMCGCTQIQVLQMNSSLGKSSLICPQCGHKWWVGED